jgi:4-coumarate--CoA ligase
VGKSHLFALHRERKLATCAATSAFAAGTTGLPKAGMIAHQNMIAQCLQIEYITSPELRKILAVLPLFHTTGLVHHLHLSI